MAGLRPKKHPFVNAFLRRNRGRLSDWLTGFSSPLHIIFPQVFAENIEKFRSALISHGLPEGIFYSCKANKSNAFIETAVRKGIGVEVSSYYELRDALSRGLQGPSIIAGGPGKTSRYLLLAITSGATVSVDSRTEIVNLLSLCRRFNRRAKILLRISNVVHPSRFGMDRPIDPKTLSLLQRSRSLIDVLGFSSHLNNYDVEDRARLVIAFVELCKQFRERGWKNCSGVDIGGGFTISYITAEEWRNYDKTQEEYWNGRTFRRSYPYYSATSGSDGLGYILDRKPNGQSVHELLKKGKYRLIIEPGEALLDQAGLTVMRISDVKALNQGNLIVVDGNTNHLSERLYDEDFLVSPELHSSGSSWGPFEGYIAGNSCMEEDMVSWHKVRFDKVPRVGDSVVFYNTAGYLMDSNESEFMRVPLPRKICAIKQGRTWRTYDASAFTQAELLDSSV